MLSKGTTARGLYYELGPSRDQRKHQRVSVSLLGRYMLPDRREFPCQTVNMSPGGLAVAAPVKPNVGDRVVVYLETLDRVEGTVSRHLDDGFALKLNVPLRKREKLADRLTWLANRHALGMPEDRRHERIVPRNQRSTMKVPDGRTYQIKIIDISMSGVAVKCDVKPAINTAVTIGDTAGRVVRHFEEGVAIEFTRLLPLEHFDENVKI